MYCPFCGHDETKVIDSRLVAGGSQIKRRRECSNCGERFSTYEEAELVMPRIIKTNGRREPFDEVKLRAGFHKALEKILADVCSNPSSKLIFLCPNQSKDPIF